MKPPPFDYIQPASIEEVLAALREHGGRAKLLAGGQSLVPMMNLRLAFPEVLVDLNGVPSLDFIRHDGDTVVVGAMTRQRTVELSSQIASTLPIIVAALGHVAHFQIRNRGTIGGSIAHGDGAAELPAVLRAVDGWVTTKRPDGETRVVDASDLFESRFTTCLEEDEIITEVSFPAPRAQSGWGFHEVVRRHGDFALAGAATTVTLEDGHISSAAISVFGVAGIPTRATQTEAGLVGRRPADVDFGWMESTAGGELSSVTGIHGSAEYRRHLAGVVVRRAVVDALERAAA